MSAQSDPAGLGAGELDETVEMRLDETSQTRNAFKMMEEVYSLLRACEALENAYIKDAVTPAVYTSQCMSLIGKFDQAVKLAQSAGAITDVKEFMAAYSIRLPAATKRLLEDKVPATAIHMQGGDAHRSANDEAAVFDLLPGFVTLLDACGMSRMPHQLLPHLLFITQNLALYTGLPSSWEGRARMNGWLTRLRGMNATDIIPADVLANFRLDTELTFEEFRHLGVQQARTRSTGAAAAGGGR